MAQSCRLLQSPITSPGNLNRISIIISCGRNRNTIFCLLVSPMLLPLEQEETMQGFIGQFEKCVGMVKGLEEPFLVEVLLNGLKE